MCILLLCCSDADLDLAAKNIVKGGFSYSGQRCTAVKVVLAMEDVADDLVAKVRGLWGTSHIEAIDWHTYSSGLASA